MKKTILSIVTIMVTLAGTPVFAQQRMQAPPPDSAREEREFVPDKSPDTPPSEERREEVRKKIEAVRIWRLTEELGLDVNTSSKLAALLGAVDRKRRDTMRDQAEAMRTLRQLLRSRKPDEAKIRQLLDRMESNQRSIEELKYAELKGVKEFLTVEQQARFVIFQQEFQREIQNMIAKARGGQDRRDSRDFRRGQGQRDLP